MGLLRRILGIASTEDAPADIERSCPDRPGPRTGRLEERSVRNGRLAATKPPQPLVPVGVHSAAAPPPAGPASAAQAQRCDARFSSLPQALAPSGQQQQPCQGSGPGAPVSPTPAAPPPVLRRVSSTPCSQHNLSHNSMASGHSSSAAGESPAGAGHETSSSSSKEGSRSGAGHPASLPAVVVAVAAAAGIQRSRQVDPDAPELLQKPPTAEQATPKWAQRPRVEEEPTQEDGTLPAAQWPAHLATPAAAGAAGAAGAEEEGDSPRSPIAAGEESPSFSSVQSGRSVSLLTFLIRGHSAASSLAASRENSIRSGVKRQPGGLSLALSRENSLRGGAARREGSVRGMQGERELSIREGNSQRGNSVSQRGNSQRSGGGRQEGSVLAQWGASGFGGLPPAAPASQQTRRGSSEQQHDQQQKAVGRGSGEWVRLAQGLTPLTELVRSPAALSTPGAASVGRAVEPSPPAPCPLPACAAPASQPQEVGSWAKRVTTFTRKPSDMSTAALTPPEHAGGPDPLLLSAALAALATLPATELSGTTPGHDVLVGDSHLAMTGSEDPPCSEQQARQLGGGGGWGGGSNAAAAAAAAPASASAALMLSNSWGATRQGFELPPLVPLGGSAPTRGCSPCNSSSRSPAAGMRVCSQPLISDVTAADQEWNRSFMKRWRTVKKRAYLQALGLRALWKVNSLSDRHEPVELLTNDLPQCDNGMRRAWSVTRLAAQLERGCATSAAQPAGDRSTSSAAPLHKDPSLGAMLLGEVAEVC